MGPRLPGLGVASARQPIFRRRGSLLPGDVSFLWSCDTTLLFRDSRICRESCCRNSYLSFVCSIRPQKTTVYIPYVLATRVSPILRLAPPCTNPSSSESSAHHSSPRLPRMGGNHIICPGRNSGSGKALWDARLDMYGLIRSILSVDLLNLSRMTIISDSRHNRLLATDDNAALRRGPAYIGVVCCHLRLPPAVNTE